MSCVCDSHLSVLFYFILSFSNCAGLGTPNGAVEQHERLLIKHSSDVCIAVVLRACRSHIIVSLVFQRNIFVPCGGGVEEPGDQVKVLLHVLRGVPFMI